MTVIKKNNTIIGIANNKEEAMRFVLESINPMFLTSKTIESAWNWASRLTIGLNQIYTFVENVPMI